MIYTVTSNPSLDYFTYGKYAIGEVNRAERAYFVPGGKGINISLILQNFGIPSVALGMAGGFTGTELLKMLDYRNITHSFVTVAYPTRVNVKCVTEGCVTEINAPAPDITAKEREAFLRLFDCVKEGDTVVLSGSDPHLIYPEVLDRVKGAFVAVDTGGGSLSECIKRRPGLIKPNIYELSELVGAEVTPLNGAEYAGSIARGGTDVLLTMGEDGALLATSETVKYAKIIKPKKAVNTVGCGDSALAGYLYARIMGTEPVVTAAAAGSASAYKEGFCTLSDMLEIMEEGIELQR